MLSPIIKLFANNSILNITNTQNYDYVLLIFRQIQRARESRGGEEGRERRERELHRKYGHSHLIMYPYVICVQNARHLRTRSISTPNTWHSFRRVYGNVDRVCYFFFQRSVEQTSCCSQQNSITWECNQFPFGNQHSAENPFHLQTVCCLSFFLSLSISLDSCESIIDLKITVCCSVLNEFISAIAANFFFEPFFMTTKKQARCLH